MLANRVKETTASTGTGNITLAGAAANHQTFNSAFGLNRRFYYYLVDDTNNTWETGIGYLSGTTTLVRENVLDNSSGTTTAINFTAIDFVFCSDSDAASQARNIAVIAGQAYVKSAHFTRESGSTYLQTVDRIHYVPFVLNKPLMCDGLGVEVTSAGAAGKIAHLALYDMDASANPQKRIVHTVDLAIDSTGIKVGTFTATLIMPGTYWFALWSDGTPTYTALTAEWAVAVQLGCDTANIERDITMRFKSAVASLTELADPGTAPTDNNYSIGPTIALLRGT